ncbi:MAG: HlyD family efflux transporter periplasmic adaptor subunit, partial [Hyphomicrobiales bacterium]|nr:HlyD family efflux transporter periplasmic adaptor subunit [Hyphomicrobiales bacterium]
VKTIIGREGDSFRAGDLLIAFDCRRYEAELKGSLADLDARQITQKSNETLLARNAIAKHEVLLSKAEVTKAGAVVEQLRTRLDQCEVRAPFDGQVSEVMVNEFEFPKAGAPLIKVISSADLEIRIIVPSDWLSWLKVGEMFRFTVDETAETIDGKIVRRAASVDAVSQTVTLFGIFVDPSANIIPGMSGSAIFNNKKAAANGAE